MHGVKLLGLMLGDLQHLHGKDTEAALLELFDDVADSVLADGIRFDDGQSALESLHKFSRWSLVDIKFVLVGLNLQPRATNSKSSQSFNWSAGMNALPKAVGSRIITPPPYSLMYQPQAGSGSVAFQATNSISASFPWKRTRSPFLMSSPDRYFSGSASIPKRRGRSRSARSKRLLLLQPPAFLQLRLETSKRGFRKLPAL